MHPYIQINLSAWKTILESLKQAIILIADETGSSEDEIKGIIQQYSTIIADDDIAIYAMLGIKQYIDTYKVAPSEGIYDEFKNIYFLGAAITQKLNTEGFSELRQIHQLAVLRLLDARLYHPYKVNRPVLSQRVASTIKNNSVNDHFGMFGWYLIYKCLFNAASEGNNKKITL
jgi:hypothetical protein